MEVGDLVFSVVSDQHQDRALVVDDASFDESPHSLVQSFPDHFLDISVDLYGLVVPFVSREGVLSNALMLVALTGTRCEAEP